MNSTKFRHSLLRNLSGALLRRFFSHSEIANINLFEQRFYSQNGEDGILRLIFKKIKVTNRFCVEFGIHADTGNKYGIHSGEGNTVLLKNEKWNCLWMDGNGDGSAVKQEFITAENINELFKKYNVPREFDLLSIDIDSNDYWVWKAIKNYSPRVIIMEYNATIPPDESKTVEYDPSLQWDGTDYYGASLLALKRLGEEKGYSLIGCDRKGINAFFVRNDLVDGNFKLQSISELYKPPRRGRKVDGKFVPHPRSDRKMMSI